MSRDCRLLNSAEEGGVGARVYSWAGPWISFGRFQNPEKDLLDPEIPWVSRPTGGKAVLHGHDVTVALAAPLALVARDERSLKAIYRTMVAPIVVALRQCGLEASLAEGTRFSGKGERTADCFAFASPNDVVNSDTGLKLCGIALRVTDSAVLVQASIPKQEPLVAPTSVIRNARTWTVSPWDDTHFADSLRTALEVLVKRDHD